MTTTLPARVCAYADRNGVPVPPPPGATTVEDWEGGPGQAPWRPVLIEWAGHKVYVDLYASQAADGSVKLKDEPLRIDASDKPLSFAAARELAAQIVSMCDQAQAWEAQR
jgi:hypothetical protein